MLVDNAAPITFAQLAHRFTKLGMTKEKYKAFQLPLSFEDITNPDLGDEIVGYRSLIAWYGGSWTSRRPTRRSRKIVPDPIEAVVTDAKPPVSLIVEEGDGDVVEAPALNEELGDPVAGAEPVVETVVETVVESVPSVPGPTPSPSTSPKESPKYTLRNINDLEEPYRLNLDASAVVYVVTETGSEHVKIGVTANPWRRLRTLQTGNPRALSFLGVIPHETAREAYAREGQLHRAFASCQVQGEWFRLPQYALDMLELTALPPAQEIV